MYNSSVFITKSDFISKLETSSGSLYATEDVFTLISITINTFNDTFCNKEVYGFIAKYIQSAIVNEKDCFSFWNNTFYILTYLDNKDVVTNFLEAMAFELKSKYNKTLRLKAAFLQYPYEIISVENIFKDIEKKTVIVNSERTSLDTCLTSDKDYNQIIGNELRNYLKLLKQYDNILYKHSLFVAKLSILLSKGLNLPRQTIKKIVISSILHDIGYLNIPKKILFLPKQDSKTIALVKMHPLLATRKILKGKSIFKEVLKIIEQHHEYLDGTGYPFGVEDSGLSLEAQIISLADNYDIIRYCKDLSITDIINFFTTKAGIRLCENLITIFTGILMDEKLSIKLNDAKEDSLTDFLNWI